MTTEKSLLAAFRENTDIDHISKPEDFFALYEKEFSPLRHDPIIVVEVGIYKGHFLYALQEYFTKARIIGIDIEDRTQKNFDDRCKVRICNQGDKSNLDKIFQELAPDGVSIIIDDASHIGSWSKALFDATFRPWLKSGGHYFIEDWQTGYRADWPDGAECSGTVLLDRAEHHIFRRIAGHDAGMVGFVKSLVDEFASWQTQPAVPSIISSMSIHNGLVLLRKA